MKQHLRVLFHLFGTGEVIRCNSKVGKGEWKANPVPYHHTTISYNISTVGVL